MKWLVIDAMGKHWERARLNAELEGDNAVHIETTNVAAFTIEMGPGGCLLDSARKPVATIDGQRLTISGPMSDRSWTVHFRKSGNQWTATDAVTVPGLHKQHGLQGPVDDAFLSSFVFVTPTGTSLSQGVATWVTHEQERAIREWRRQFRGEAQLRLDSDVTQADIAASNLILWGDPRSNKVLARIADQLPVKWTAEGVVVGATRYPADTHVPIMIYPNPLNPRRYVVLNSGFTFREADYLSNARQTPKLPDYAIVDISVPPDYRRPGKVVLAGFFGEKWEF